MSKYSVNTNRNPKREVFVDFVFVTVRKLEQPDIQDLSQRCHPERSVFQRSEGSAVAFVLAFAVAVVFAFPWSLGPSPA
jgi:hypothetical protein